jgi:predicted NBD/HSP70 family sugar kinase
MPVRRIIGVDMGRSRLRAGAVDADLSVHRRAQRSVAGLGRAGTVAAVVEAVQEAGELAGAEAVGLALPGTDPDPVLADAVSERVGLPVAAAGAGTLAALAEHRAGAARGVQDALVITVGDRVRGGVVTGGRLGEEIDFGEGADARVSELAHDGDLAARETLAALADRVAALVAELRPDLVVVGASEPLLGEVRARVAEPVRPAWFGAEATMVGAAALALAAAADGDPAL